MAEVRPATREVVWANQREVLEPRVMQVLVVLARQPGEVVSRDGLTLLCWGGRVVGDDAINRCIGQLRRLSERVGGFEVETITRVGYRLTEPAGPRRAPRLRPGLVALALVLAVLALAGALVWRMGPWRTAAPEEPRIAIQPVTLLGGDARLKELAAVLSDDIAGVLNQTHVGAMPVGTGGPRADILVGAAMALEGDQLRVRAYLLDARSGYILWSESFAGSVEAAAVVRDEVAGAVTEAASIALEPYQQKGLQLDPQTLALYVKGTWAFTEPDALRGEEASQAYRAAVARNPKFVAARSMLALLEALPATQEPKGPARTEAIARVRGEALKAIADDARAAGGAFEALSRLDRYAAPTDLVRLEDELLAGAAKAPLAPFLHVRECELLVEVGRARDAITYCQRAIALRPLGTPFHPPYAHALYVDGDLDLARDELATALRFHPDSLNARTRRAEMALFSEDPDEALRRIRDDKLRPQDWQADHVALAELFLRARRTHDPVDAHRFLDEARRMMKAGRLPPRYLVLCAATLGDLDAAFEILTTPGLDFEPDGFLFEPEAAALRRDRRFWTVAQSMGLVSYWRTRNVWPEFCSEPTLPYDCRVEAARLVASPSAVTVKPGARS
ncbi:winged helix-turn-helix domain-containing protein [Phenylobacterium sp.]|uniref:winged helix-turn-helix domain-containing protein n=1 Tax=Phenylobacterium sp. TaxID=1871053 RepID=UPI002E35E2A1|nr:winged helix-turn-helix domain-containing protein [Phenylobacterium sp.]HEX3363791.1 winged helix-turn-helix domain-containing protein [Phenylobacterium sp.]